MTGDSDGHLYWRTVSTILVISVESACLLNVYYTGQNKQKKNTKEGNEKAPLICPGPTTLFSF